MADSDSDDANTPKKLKVELTVKEKETRYLEAAKIAPEYDSMDLQDCLVRVDWDVQEALKLLKANCRLKNAGGGFVKGTNVAAVKSSTSTSSDVANNNSKTQNGHTKKSKAASYSDCDDSGDEVGHADDQVYDSDESDTETNNEMTGQRRKVFEFMNTASLVELQTVKTLSEKKAGLIVELRPFKDWKDLCKKLQSNKLLNAGVLNNAQELINKQNNVAFILEKCNKMVKRLEAAIETGAGIVDQPSLLNPE